MTPPFNPNDVVARTVNGRASYHRIYKCYRPNDMVGWRVLLRRVHCRDPFGFPANAFRHVEEPVLNGDGSDFNFIQLMGARA